MQAMNLAQQQTQEQQKQEQKQRSSEQRGREEEKQWKRRSERRHRTRSPSRSPPTRSPSPPSRYTRRTSPKRSLSRTRRPKPEVFLPLLIYFSNQFFVHAITNGNIWPIHMLFVNVPVQPEIEVDPQDPEDLNSFRDKRDYFQKIGERKKTKNRGKTSLVLHWWHHLHSDGQAVEQQCSVPLCNHMPSFKQKHDRNPLKWWETSVIHLLE